MTHDLNKPEEIYPYRSSKPLPWDAETRKKLLARGISGQKPLGWNEKDERAWRELKARETPPGTATPSEEETELRRQCTARFDSATSNEERSEVLREFSEQNFEAAIFWPWFQERQEALAKAGLPLYPNVPSKKGESQVAESESSKEVAAPFTHSEDYRSVTLRAKTYTLTTGQALIIQSLHECHENGTPEVSTTFIQGRLGTPSSRWQNTFKSNPEAKKALVKSGARRGTLRLNL